MSHEVFLNTPESFEGIFDPSLHEAVAPPYVKEHLQPVFIDSPWTFAHSVRVARIVSDLYDLAGVSFDEKLLGQRGALLHDIGKVRNPEIPLVVLNAKRELTDEEFLGMKTHPSVGFNRILPHDPYVAKIVVAHHELQCDCSYPRREGSFVVERRTVVSSHLRRDQHFLALADTVDALFSSRPYKAPWLPGLVRAEVDYKFGALLSPKFLDAAVDIGRNRVIKEG